MSEQDDSEKTEEPTAKRIRDAREKGQVPRSRDLSSATIVAGSGMALYWGVGGIGENALAWMRSMLSFDVVITDRIPPLGGAFGEGFVGGMSVVVPLFAVCMLIALVSPALIGGWNLSTKAMAPDFGKVNPIKGLGRVFSKNGLMELAKALLKFSVVSVIAVYALRKFAPELLGLSSESGYTGIMHGLQLIGLSVIWFSGGLLLIAAVDVPFQLWQHTEKLKMTLKEVRDEHKEAEGSPEVKGRMRRMQEEASKQRMMQDVPQADVVITNPTHFAIALKYSEGGNRAPVLVAKGGDLVAAQIRGVASQHKVPIVEVPMLARALYYSVEIGQEIPAVLYKAVAQILGYVMQLRVAHYFDHVPELPEVDVPDGMTRPPHERMLPPAGR